MAEDHAVGHVHVRRQGRQPGGAGATTPSVQRQSPDARPWLSRLHGIGRLWHGREVQDVLAGHVDRALMGVCFGHQDQTRCAAENGLELGVIHLEARRGVRQGCGLRVAGGRECLGHVDTAAADRSAPASAYVSVPPSGPGPASMTS